MLMNPWKKIYMTLMLLMAVLLVLTACASSVLAQDSAIPPGPPPHPPFAQGLAKGDYLYVLDMHFIHQYSLTDMRLTRTVSLPEPTTLPALATTDGRPPMPPRSSFIATTEEADPYYLYVLEMRSLYKYKLPGLELVQTVTLPEPDPQ